MFFLKFKILKANKKHIKEIQEISTQQFGLLGWAPNFFESELKNENHFFYVVVVVCVCFAFQSQQVHAHCRGL